MFCTVETDFFCVCLCAPAGQSVVVTPESGSQGGNYCSGRQTLRSGRTCHTLPVQRLFGGKAQSLSLLRCCSSQCVFGNTIDGQTPPSPQLRFFIMQILHQVPQSSATIWKTLILISGLVYGVRLMKALWCQAACLSFSILLLLLHPHCIWINDSIDFI